MSDDPVFEEGVEPTSPRTQQPRNSSLVSVSPKSPASRDTTQTAQTPEHFPGTAASGPASGQESLIERGPNDFMIAQIANILLENLQRNLSDDKSDYSYVMSMFPFFQGMEPGAIYTYPDTPKGINFRRPDRVAHVDEVARYLMIGIRVWDKSGRRLHFHGTPINYDSLNVFRHPRKRICTQDPTQRPDLWVQIEAGTYDEGTNIDSSCNQQEDRVASRTMPWDVKMPVPEMTSEGLSILSRVRLAWIASRYENARSSYSREKFLEYEAYGGKRISLEDLTHSELPSSEANFIGPYPEIGVDSPYISIRYPPTKVSLVSESGEEVEATNELCTLCATLDFKDLFEWGILDVDIDFGSTEDLMSRKDCNFCRGLSILCEDGVDHLARYMQNPQLNRSHAKFNLAHPIKVSVVRNPILCRSTKPFVVLAQSSQKEHLDPIVSLRTVRGDIRGEYKLEHNRRVNLNLIKQMVERCSASHGANCG